MALTGSPTVAVVGLGYAASALHLPAARSIGARVVAGADPDLDRRRRWTEAGSGPAFADLDTLIDQVGPDIVVVATPPDSHAELCRAALLRGANVICEKPFVEKVEQAEDVLRTAADCGRRVAVNHEFRYMPIFSTLAATVGTAEVGQPVFLSCAQLMDLAPWDEPVAWRAAMPHRSLFEAGVHIIDLLDLVIGRSPATVTAHISGGVDAAHRGGADAVHLVTLDYGVGLLAQVTINRLCKAGTRYLDLRVDCENASLRASYGGRALLQLGVKRAQRPGVRVEFGFEGLAWVETGLDRRVLARNPRRAAARATAALYADVVRAWSDDADPPTSGQHARDALLVVDAAYESARTGTSVSLPAG